MNKNNDLNSSEDLFLRGYYKLPREEQRDVIDYIIKDIEKLKNRGAPAATIEECEKLVSFLVETQKDAHGE